MRAPFVKDEPRLRKSTAGFSTRGRRAGHSRPMSIWGWFVLGAGSWALAVVLKVLADVIVQRTTTVALRDGVAAALSGVWSAVCELGLAALAFWYWGATFADALVMATGAALAEFLILLPAAFSANWGQAKRQTKAKVTADWRSFLAERAVAFASHLASRGLVWLGIGGAAGVKAVAAAFGLFAITEGIQAYGQAKEWDWLNPRVLLGFLTMQGVFIALTIALLILWWA